MRSLLERSTVAQDFLSEAATPQGTLDETTLADSRGRRRHADRSVPNAGLHRHTNGNWGCAASNWVWGSVAADDAYKGSDGTDQPPINDIEGYHWGTPDAETYLNNNGRSSMKASSGPTRRYACSRRYRRQARVNSRPTDAKGIEGEATFLRAHYHFEA